MADQWEISITESASIVVEPRSGTTSYRYDLPAHALTGEDAIRQLVTHVRDQAGTQWPKITVSIDAEEPVASEVETALRAAGVTVERPGGVIGSEEDVIDLTKDNDRPVTGGERLGTPSRLRPRATPRGRIRRTAGWLAERTTIFSIGVVVLVVLVIAASWWSMQRALDPYELAVAQPGDDVGSATESSGQSLGDHAPGSGDPPERADSSEAGGEQDSRQRGAVLEHEGVRVEAPLGYRISAQEDSYLLTGDDPNLRILLAVDRIYSVPVEAVMAELHETVARDPTLGPEDSPLTRRGGLPQLSYREQPGDGSTVTWVVWVDHNTQFSVGCHSRTSSTPAHRAACRMVVDSFQLTDHPATGTETEHDASIHIENHARA